MANETSKDQMCDKTFRERLERKYAIWDIPEDGNSLYASLALAIFKDPSKHQTIREQIYQYLMDNTSKFQKYLYGSREAMLRQISLIRINLHFGSDVSIAAASELYSIKIIVLSCPDTKEEYSSDTLNETIYLSCHGYSHYNLLTKLEDAIILDTENVDTQDFVQNDSIYLHKEVSNECDSAKSVSTTFSTPRLQLVVPEKSPEEIAEVEQRRLRVIEDQLQVYINQYFRIYPVPMDGNCLYSAISCGVYQTESRQAEVRQRVHRYMIGHLDYYKDFYPECKTRDALKKQVDSCLTAGEWGGEPNINAASLDFKINIGVLSRAGIIKWYPDTKEFSREFHISFHEISRHYNYLITKQIKAKAKSKDAEQSAKVKFNDNMETRITTSSLSSCKNDPHNEDKYVMKNFARNARDKVDVILLVADANSHSNLSEYLRFATPSLIMIYEDYRSGEGLKKILTDVDLREDFSVYSHIYTIPQEEPLHDRDIWLLPLIIVPLILSAAQFYWKGSEIHTLCNKSWIGKPETLVSTSWGKMRNAIKEDINEIMRNPDNFICNECSDNCIFKQKLWHFDLRYFRKLDYNPGETSGFLADFSPYISRAEPESNVLFQLRQIYESQPSDALPKIFEILDLHYENENSGNWWCSYMVLIMDGPDMPVNDSSPVRELLARQDVHKVIYAGSVKNQRFRRAHFVDPNDSIRELLTATTQMYFVRTKIFYSKKEARVDEAIVIEILKTYLSRFWNKRQQPPFSILNIRSETSELLKLNKIQRTNITKYCESGVPPFIAGTPEMPNFPDGVFTGNYQVTEKVRIPNGNYRAREFFHVEQLYYNLEKIERS